MPGIPLSLPLQARTQLLSPVLDGSKGWDLLYWQGERLRNPADHVLAIPERICFQCSAGGVWGGTQLPQISHSSFRGKRRTGGWPFKAFSILLSNNPC